MNRREWGEIVGDKGTVVDDLRWTLFSAERCIVALDADREEAKEIDHVMYASFCKQRAQAKRALAALWRTYD